MKFLKVTLNYVTLLVAAEAAEAIFEHFNKIGKIAEIKTAHIDSLLYLFPFLSAFFFGINYIITRILGNFKL